MRLKAVVQSSRFAAPDEPRSAEGRASDNNALLGAVVLNENLHVGHSLCATIFRSHRFSNAFIAIQYQCAPHAGQRMVTHAHTAPSEAEQTPMAATNKSEEFNR